jgi:hypothetical protein
MHTQKNITFQDALEVIEALPEYQQEDIVYIIHKRLIDHRREVLAKNIKKAKEEYKKGEIKRGNVNDLMRELSE